MWRNIFRLFLPGLAVTFLIASTSSASACGGFFCTTQPVLQSAERIVFAVNDDDGTITAVVGIAYSGAANQFSWVVPVPSEPKVDVAETESIDALSAATTPRFIIPSNPCPVPSPMAVAAAQATMIVTLPSLDFVKTGQIGPYDYAIIKNKT